VRVDSLPSAREEAKDEFSGATAPTEEFDLEKIERELRMLFVSDHTKNPKKFREVDSDHYLPKHKPLFSSRSKSVGRSSNLKESMATDEFRTRLKDLRRIENIPSVPDKSSTSIDTDFADWGRTEIESKVKDESHVEDKGNSQKKTGEKTIVSTMSEEREQPATSSSGLRENSHRELGRRKKKNRKKKSNRY
jgi:hypothetical protein